MILGDTNELIWEDDTKEIRDIRTPFIKVNIFNSIVRDKLLKMKKKTQF
jgi:hypothetical protein